MGFWRFMDEQSLSGLTELVPTYDYSLGWVAGLLAVCAGLALFPTLTRVRSSRTTMSRRAWHFGGAVTMSIGFWGAQNMALLGFGLPASYFYEPVTGFTALLPAVAGCAAMIHVLGNPSPSLGRLHLGALSLALGIAAMHYTLMEAIQGDIILAYDIGLFAMSLLLGYVFASIALYVNRALNGVGQYVWIRWPLGSFVLAMTVVGYHYSAMAGTTFFDNPAIMSSGVSAAPAYLVPAIVGSVLFLITVYWLGSVVDGRLAEAGEAVRNSEARHRAVVEFMLDAHLIIDWQGIVRSFNPAAEDAFGWKATEIIGQPVARLIDETDTSRERDWPARSAMTAAMLPTRRRWVYPEGGRRRDGHRFPVELAVSSFEVEGERFFSCVVRNLSGSWDSEARLRRLGAAIEQAGDAITLLGADHRIEYVNPQYEKQTGYSREEVIGLQPFRGATDQVVHTDIWTTVRHGRAWSGQVRTRRRDGSLCDEELTMTPVLDTRGGVSGYVAVTRDITRRLEAELERRRLAEALQHCTDSIEILDSQGRIVYVNAAFEASDGQRLADIRGSRPEALADFGADGESYDDMMRTAYRGGRPWSGTLKSYAPGGEIREEEVTVSPMRDDRAQVSGYVVVKRDTTDRRRLEAQAQHRQKLESIGQLADGIAQELHAPMQRLADDLEFLRGSFRSLDQLLGELSGLGDSSVPVPPAAIAGCMQSADVDFLRREIAHALEQSGEGAKRVAGIVGAMREISYSGAQTTNVDLNRAIQSTIIVTASEWQAVAEIRTDFDAGLPPVRCMPGDISLVLLNMLVQAAQAIAASNSTGIKGKGVIAVSTKRINDCVEIRISNTGGGITPDQRQEMFNPQLSPGPAGQGPNLFVAHDIIVCKHGGTIALESEPGHGATFIIRLPIETLKSSTSTAAA